MESEDSLAEQERRAFAELSRALAEFQVVGEQVSNALLYWKSISARRAHLKADRAKAEQLASDAIARAATRP